MVHVPMFMIMMPIRGYIYLRLYPGLACDCLCSPVFGVLRHVHVYLPLACELENTYIYDFAFKSTQYYSYMYGATTIM